MNIQSDKPDWVAMLNEAITKPGKLSEAYSLFHNYSLGNRVLASEQLIERGLPLAPIASFMRWKELGRSVKKGEKAIALFMPVTVKRKKVDEATGEEVEAGTGMVFTLKRNWFSLDQTEGEEYQPEPWIPDWDRAHALGALGIEEEPFQDVRGNVQGYASGRTIAVSPIAVLPHKTRFHELAHVMLGHTESTVMSDAPELPKCIKEAEAEATAYLCCATLGLPGLEESRGYIQSWLDGAEFPEKSARRVFAVADKILKAGAAQVEPIHE